MTNVITYIDGFNLYHGIRSKYGRKYIWLDIQQLSEELMTPEETLIEVNYFTAMIGNAPQKEFRQKTYISALETLTKVNIHYGKYQVNLHTCPKCNFVEKIPSEKMTDVNIATRLLTDAFNNHYDTAKLITADSDLVGPIRTIRQLFPHKKIIVCFPPDRVSFELKNIASAYFHIPRTKLARSQFSNQIMLKNGTLITKPTSWV